jgi:hypothetical protein
MEIMEAKESKETRTDDLLFKWSEWMQTGNSIGRGFPTTSCGMAQNGDSSVEDMEMSVDSVLVKAVNAAVGDLPAVERSAVHHCYLGDVYRHDAMSYVVMLNKALGLVRIGCDKRGIY